MKVSGTLPVYSGPSSIYPNRGVYEAHISKLIRMQFSGNNSELIVGEFSIDGLSPDQLDKFKTDLGFELFDYGNRFFHSPDYQNEIFLVFEDFRPIAFVRDMVLAKVLEMSFKYLKRAIRNLSKEVIVVDVAEYQFCIQFPEGLLNVNIVCKPEILFEIVHNIDSYLTNEVISQLLDDRFRFTGNTKLFIRYNETEKTIEVNRAVEYFYQEPDWLKD
jgi:hypothetical protein